jgi:hypothetical protein
MAHEKKGQEAGQKMGTQLFRQGAMTRRPDDEAKTARGRGSKTKRSRMNQGMYSSASDEWETPQEFFDALDEIFHFTLDVCATPENAKCPRYFTKAEDGLATLKISLLYQSSDISYLLTWEFYCTRFCVNRRVCKMLIIPVHWGQQSERMKYFCDRLRRCEARKGDDGILAGKKINLVAAAVELVKAP